MVNFANFAARLDKIFKSPLSNKFVEAYWPPFSVKDLLPSTSKMAVMMAVMAVTMSVKMSVM